MEFKDYYKTLGVAPAATQDEIKKAYRKLARKHHPDLSQAADANEHMVELNEAHAVLSDAERRAAYDAIGAGLAPEERRDFRPFRNRDAGFDFSDGDAAQGDHSDFFAELFGRRPGGGGPRAPQRGRDQHARIELDIADAYTGSERSIGLHGARLDEAGRPVNDEQRLQVQIPKGVHEGQHIRLAGRGGAGSAGGPAGDLLLEVAFKPDPRWRSQGTDVYQRVPLSPWEAMLGATAVIRTPGGDTEVRLPAGWTAGRKLRLKGLGIPARTAGNLYLELELALPPADSDDARAAYAALARAFPLFEPRQAARQ